MQITIDPKNKRYRDAIKILSDQNDRQKWKTEVSLFGLALIFGLVINLLSTYIDAWIKEFFPNFYIYFQLFIAFLAILIFLSVLRIIYKYYEAQKKSDHEFYEISKLNPKKTLFTVGDKMKSEEWEYKIKKIFYKYSLISRGINYKSDGKFTIIELEVTNLKNVAIGLVWSNISLTDNNGFTYKHSAKSYGLNKDSRTDLIPNKKYKFSIAFELPKKSNPIRINFDDELFEINLEIT